MAVTEHPDVILMDLEMPDADCCEVVRRLKNDAQTGHIPIISMSAYALASERENAIATGCDEFDGRSHSARAYETKINSTRADSRIQDGAPAGSRTVNTDPLPASLAKVTSPPIMRASLREMARPSPVPP